MKNYAWMRTDNKEFPADDPVNSPKHYNMGGIECIDALAAATIGKSGVEAVCVGNIIKYLWRYESKNGLVDIEKARWYLDRLHTEVSKRAIQQQL